jgi:transcriptional antiterminator RfaH
MSSPWLLAHTQPQCEQRAAANLERQGYEIYFPRYLKRRRHARKLDLVEAPLFPRYVFVNIETAAKRWRSIQSTLGVSRLVLAGDKPALVPTGIIDSLRASEGEDGFVKLNRRRPFSAGDRVRILAGAFMDSLGIYEGLGDHERVAILLDLLGRKVRVMLDANLVTAA